VGLPLLILTSDISTKISVPTTEQKVERTKNGRDELRTRQIQCHDSQPLCHQSKQSLTILSINAAILNMQRKPILVPGNIHAMLEIRMMQMHRSRNYQKMGVTAHFVSSLPSAVRA
jgi:hypothetical protein